MIYKEVHCPKCHALVGHIYFERQRTVETRCRKCQIKIKYDVRSGKSKVEPLQLIRTSSGVRY